MTTVGRKAVLGWSRVFGLIVAFILSSGCLILPIPTLDHGEGLSKSEADDYLVPGQTTRTDVLLTLGDPEPTWWSDKSERVFYYHWVRRHGYTFVIPLPIPIPPIGVLPPAEGLFHKNAWEHHAYLAQEFAVDGTLARYKYWSLKDAGSFPSLLEEWMTK